MKSQKNSARSKNISFVTSRQNAEYLEELARATNITRSALCSAILGAAIKMLTSDQLSMLFMDEDNESKIRSALMATVGGCCE